MSWNPFCLVSEFLIRVAGVGLLIVVGRVDDLFDV